MKIYKKIYLNHYISCVAKSDYLILDKTYYNSGDPELIDLFGPLVTLNTINCDGFNFSYSASIMA